MTWANEVCRRCAWSNGDRRTRRCLPRSALRIPYAFSPSIVKVADLRPASSPGLASSTSVLKLRLAAQRRYMRRSSSVKSWASVPPASDWIVTTASPPSYSPEKSASSWRRSSSDSSGTSDVSISAAMSPSMAEELLRVVVLAAEALVAVEAPLDARVLGGDGRSRLLVVPEAGLAHPRLELGGACL